MVIEKEDKKIKEQQLQNIKIVQEIFDKVIENPELRFIQLLWSIGIIDYEDRFYEKSAVTLEKVVAKRKKLQGIKEQLGRKENAQ